MNVFKIPKIFVFFILIPIFFSHSETVEKVFTNIYRAGKWGVNQHGEGFSGVGSQAELTIEYRLFLQNFLQSHNIHSVVDAGCGDWTFSRLINWDRIDYSGFDVVRPIIVRNKKRFGKPNVHFFYGDATKMKLPKADLLICKDVLQHLTNKDILNFILQLPSFRYCLITNDIDPYDLTSANLEIERGKHRYVDLTQPPFNLQGTKILTFVVGPRIKQVFFIDNSQLLK